MRLPALGSIRSPVTICVKNNKGAVSYVRHHEAFDRGGAEYIGIATIPPNLLLDAGCKIEDAKNEEEVEPAPAPVQKLEGIQALATIEENDDAAFNNPQSDLLYNRLVTDATKKSDFEFKNARKAKGADRLATVTGTSRKKPETAKDFIARRKRGSAK